ncbi:ABC transporter ATP-binding protein [Spirosoma daeguense]
MFPINSEHLNFSAGGRQLLKDVSLQINDGETVALLGQNGAGKSTLLSVLLGDIKPDSGSVTFGGQTFEQVRGQIGVVYDQIPSFGLMKVKEILDYFSSIYGLYYKQETELLDLLGLEPLLDKFLRVLSQGERRKVGLFLGLMHRPELLILDESTADLDPNMRDILWTRVFRRYCRTILFTTHDWQEAETRADRIFFMHQGNLLLADTPRNLLSTQYIRAEKKIILSKSEVNVDLLENELYVEDDNSYHVFVSDLQGFFGKVKGRTPNFSFAPKRLQDVYQYLINA